MESTCTCGSRNDLRDTSDLAGNRHHPPGIGAPGHAQSTQTVGPPVAAASRLRCCTRKHEAQVRQRRPARPHSQSDGQPRAGPPGQRQPDGRQRCLQASRAARPTPVSARRTCTRCSRRGRRRTGAPATTPAPAALRRQSRQMTPITGMHPCRHPPAPPVRHRDPRAGGCAAITTVPTQSMSSITTGDRCGSRTRQQHSPATTREHHAKPAGITQSAPEPLTATNDTPGAPGGGRCPRCTGRPRQAS